MANFKQQFGSDKVTRTTDTNAGAAGNDTPQQKKFERATGKDSDSATGDVAKKERITTDPSRSGIQAPKGADKDVWAAAEESALGLNGGFGGIGPEGRKAQIQEQYDKMVESDNETKKWAQGSGILGDIGNDKPK